jgi:hypothetical protein
MAALSTLCALSVLLSGNSAFALGTTAGTSIPNIAVVDYSDPYGVLQPRVSSPTCTVTVAQNAGVQVTPTSGSVTEKAGNSIYYPVTVTNTGNFSDTFSLSTTSTKGWSPKVIKDDNGDGVHQSTEVTVLTSSGAVAPDATLKAFISETIPSTITAATSDSVAFKATSATNTTLSASSTVTVSATVTTATAGITITPTSGTKSDKAGSVSYFPLTLANTGTASDTFSLAVGDTMGYGPKIIRDDNGDGVYQTTEVTTLSSTGSLASKAA